MACAQCGKATSRCLLPALCWSRWHKMVDFQGVGKEKRPSGVLLCAGGGILWRFVLCRQTVISDLSDLCERAVGPAVFLQSLAEDVPMALLGDGLDLFSLFQYNFFNQYFWNAVFFCFVFISYVTAMLFILATLWAETEWFAVPKTVYSSNVCLWSCAKYKLH